MSYPVALAELALFLDVDGTLIDIASSPTAVVVPAGLVELLGGLADRCDGALALLSGRPIQDIDALFRPLKLPVGGVHGAEMRMQRDGTIDRPMPSTELRTVTAALSRKLPTLQGIVMENKGVAVAVHYRAAPQLATEGLELVRRTCDEHGGNLEVMEGKHVLEIRSRGVNKGTAMARFMAVPPFAGRKPVMVGDDITDVDGFRIATALGGGALRVGNAEGRWQETPRFRSPAEVRAWLALLLRDDGAAV